MIILIGNIILANRCQFAAAIDALPDPGTALNGDGTVATHEG